MGTEAIYVVTTFRARGETATVGYQRWFQTWVDAHGSLWNEEYFDDGFYNLACIATCLPKLTKPIACQWYWVEITYDDLAAQDDNVTVAVKGIYRADDLPEELQRTYDAFWHGGLVNTSW